MTTVDLSSVAGTADTVIKDVMKVEPAIISAVGMFVPGAAPIAALVQPWIVTVVPFIEKALENIQAGNNGDAFSSIFELIQHITAGQPNSSALSVTPKPDPVPASG